MKKRKTHSIATQLIDRIIRMPYGRLFGFYAFGVLLCALAYYLLSIYAPQHAPTIPQSNPVQEFLDALYFSIITATSVGFGDIVPKGFSKCIAGLESITALFIFGVLISKPISHYQELALSQVHTLTFNDIFTNVREGFFIVRKDVEVIIDKATHAKTIAPRDWHNLAVAYRHYCSLLESIPDFYADDNDLYTIDRRREQLLIDAMQRTIERMLDMLQALEAANIQWKKDIESFADFKIAVKLTTSTLKMWAKNSPYGNQKVFTHMHKAATELAAA